MPKFEQILAPHSSRGRPMAWTDTLSDARFYLCIRTVDSAKRAYTAPR